MRRDDGESADTGNVTINSRAREVRLVGRVNDATGSTIMGALRDFERRRGEPIHLIITSPGGDEDIGWAVYDQIRSMSTEVQVEGFGICSSIAVLICQAARLRFLSANCRMLLHNGSMVIEGSYNVAQAGAQEVRFLTRRYYEAIAERSGESVRTIRRLCDRETVLSAQKALDLGLADGIIVSGKSQQSLLKKSS